jgi:hypothetical protein
LFALSFHGAYVFGEIALELHVYTSVFLPPLSQANKVYIGGLPENTRQEDLQNCFGKIGNIVNIELK